MSLNRIKKKIIQDLIVNKSKKTDLRSILQIFKNNTINNPNYLINTHSNNKKINYVVGIKITHSNILLNLVDYRGNSVIKISSGLCYFKGKLKASRYAATIVAENFLLKVEEYLKEKGMIKHGTKSSFSTAVHITGLKKNRKVILRILKKNMQIKLIKNSTLISHNGCRISKK